MQQKPIRRIFRDLMIGIVMIAVLGGCESGDQVIDEATGNRALKQYKAAKEELNTIDARQKEKYETLRQNEAPEKQSE